MKSWIVQYQPLDKGRWYTDSRHSERIGADLRMEDLRKGMNNLLQASRIVCIEILRYEDYMKENLR